MTATEHLKAKPIAGGVVAGLGTASGQHGSAHYDHSESWVFHGLPVAFAVVMNTSQPSVDWIGASRWLGVAPLFLNP